MNAIVLPYWVVTAVVPVPAGAYPSYAQGYYARDNAFYLAWDEIARDRKTFTAGWSATCSARATMPQFLRSLPVEALKQSEAA